MKVTIEKSLLAKALGHVQSVVERRNTIPILSNVLMQAGRNALSLTATDLDIEVSEEAPADVVADGSTTVSAVTLFEIVKRLPDGAQVVLESVPANGRLQITAGRSEFSLAALPADDFPSLTSEDFAVRFSMPTEDLKRLLQKSRFAMSQEETRYYLNGVFFHTEPDGETPLIRAAATDGHRLARLDADLPSGAQEMPGVIVPRKAIIELSRLLDDADELIEIAVSSTKIRFQFGFGALTSKLIDGSFPDYERVIPKTNKNVMRVKTKEFSDAVDRVSTVSADRTRSIKLGLSADKLKLSVNNPDSGSAVEEIAVDYAGEPIEIGFNARYLLDVANQIDGEEMALHLADSASPTVILDQDDERALFVLMPLRV